MFEAVFISFLTVTLHYSISLQALITGKRSRVIILTVRISALSISHSQPMPATIAFSCLNIMFFAKRRNLLTFWVFRKIAVLANQAASSTHWISKFAIFNTFVNSFTVVLRRLLQPSCIILSLNVILLVLILSKTLPFFLIKLIPIFTDQAPPLVTLQIATLQNFTLSNTNVSTIHETSLTTLAETIVEPNNSAAFGTVDAFAVD